MIKRTLHSGPSIWDVPIVSLPHHGRVQSVRWERRWDPLSKMESGLVPISIPGRNKLMARGILRSKQRTALHICMYNQLTVWLPQLEPSLSPQLLAPGSSLDSRALPPAHYLPSGNLTLTKEKWPMPLVSSPALVVSDRNIQPSYADLVLFFKTLCYGKASSKIWTSWRKKFQVE